MGETAAHSLACLVALVAAAIAIDAAGAWVGQLLEVEDLGAGRARRGRGVQECQGAKGVQERGGKVWSLGRERSWGKIKCWGVG